MVHLNGYKHQLIDKIHLHLPSESIYGKLSAQSVLSGREIEDISFHH